MIILLTFVKQAVLKHHNRGTQIKLPDSPRYHAS